MKIVIATRGSALALWQAHHVEAALKARDATVEIALSIIKTTGDAIQDVLTGQRLEGAGGASGTEGRLDADQELLAPLVVRQRPLGVAERALDPRARRAR